MKAFHITILFCLMTSALASGADGGDGGNWKVPLSDLPRIRDEDKWLSEDYSPAAQASSRIPPACILGVTNTRFQWVPGYFDIPIYLIEKYHVVGWIHKKAIPFLKKYVPVLVNWEENFEKARNAAIIATPIVLKILRKF